MLLMAKCEIMIFSYYKLEKIRRENERQR